MNPLLSRRFLLPLMAVAVLGAAAMAPPPFGAGADTAAVLAASTAEVRAEAELAGAPDRAPVTWALTEEAYAEGLLARRRADLAPRPLRDYRPAVAAFESAERHGRAALAVARAHDGRLHARVSDLLAEARADLALLDDVETAIGMEDGTRRRLQRARGSTSEAEHLLGSGGLEASLSMAERAREETREVAVEIATLTARYADPDMRTEWRRWIDETVAWSRSTGGTAVVVLKDEHRVVVYRGGREVRTYQAELGWNNLPDKLVQGDGATPEGRYRVTVKKDRGQTRYHRALLLDYPNAGDVAELQAAVRAGRLPAGSRPGGLIELHGNGGRNRDWTDGCVALTDADMDDLWARVERGTPVTIVGSGGGEGAFSGLAGRLAR